MKKNNKKMEEKQMSKKKEEQLDKAMMFFIIVAMTIVSLLIAYQTGGLIRLELVASMGICVFKMMRTCNIRDFCMVILCATLIMLTTRENDFSYIVILLGMIYAGATVAIAVDFYEE